MDQAEIEKVVLDFVAAMNPSGGWDRLPEVERTIALVYILELEVSNGGFSQFFVNPAGDRWSETLAALTHVGATRIAALFERALAVFPGGRPSSDQLLRGRQLKAAAEAGDRLLDGLTQEYYGLYRDDPGQDSYACTAAFLIQQGRA